MTKLANIYKDYRNRVTVTKDEYQNWDELFQQYGINA